jgi:hydrogenase maturation protease
MDLKRVERIANAVLYEGYLLYPYRHSSIKNQQRFNFGVVYPHDYGNAHDELSCMQTECLATGDLRTAIGARVRFLHLTGRDGWQEAIEREEVALDLRMRDLLSAPHRINFEVPSVATRPGIDSNRQKPVSGDIEIFARQVADQEYRITTRVMNLTPMAGASRMNRDEALLYSMVSTHTILSIVNGEFFSMMDPPEAMRERAEACRNLGTFPVLVGEEGDRSAMLSSPIILYDYPEIAPESAGDLFDGTEIDEILTLRILTLTDDEKREMREGDDRAKRILERIESAPIEQLMKLHGVIRNLR